MANTTQQQASRWKARLTGATSVLDVPSDHPRTGMPISSHAYLEHDLEEVLSTFVQDYGRRNGVDASIVLRSRDLAERNSAGRYHWKREMPAGPNDLMGSALPEVSFPNSRQSRSILPRWKFRPRCWPRPATMPRVRATCCIASSPTPLRRLAQPRLLARGVLPGIGPYVVFARPSRASRCQGQGMAWKPVGGEKNVDHKRDR